ncbi:MAG: phosphate acyltransferase PlsX [Candidatus Margulisiibacteriota bacterium]
MKIALDVMGGDHAPGEIIKGAYLALNTFDAHLILVGPSALLEQELPKYGTFPHPRLSIHHAPESVDMGESPAESFRKKKQSSIRVGLELVKEGQADAFVSAGNTGAVMATSTLVLGRIPNIERPAIAATLPSEKGPFVMLDMGSSVDCKPEHLAQFALMGHYFSSLVLDRETPRVGLLNIGEEPGKGNLACQEAHALIQAMPLNFIGNVEGKDILKGDADVIVCDGFVGNNLLKFGEGVSTLFYDFFKKEAKQSVLSLMALLLLKPALKRFRKQFDYQEYGGAPLLGVNGVSIIAHGKSSAKAIESAIGNAIHAVEQRMVEKITKAVSQ